MIGYNMVVLKGNLDQDELRVDIVSGAAIYIVENDELILFVRFKPIFL